MAFHVLFYVLLLLNPNTIGINFCVGIQLLMIWSKLCARRPAKILLGALKGGTDLIREGMNEEGDVNALEPRYGSTLFKMGQMWIDYPQWPALHIAMNSGQQAHLNAAFFLMKSGADVNYYQEYVYNPSNNLDHGYAPALVYPLGFGGKKLLQSHAALLQRLFITIPEKFNMSQIESGERPRIILL